MGIFIKGVTVQNYKCFADKTVELKVPDGTRGSGLNILIGENGNGKTALLEAINYLTQSAYTSENKLSINDFLDYKSEISILAHTDEFSCGSSIEYYKAWSFKAKGIRFVAKSREKKESGKLLSSPFAIHSYFDASEDRYRKEDGSIAKDRDGHERTVDGRDKMFGNARIADEDGLNIFYFDKNRARHLTTGNYKTTFERICDDLNWNFVKNLDDDKLQEIVDSVVGKYFTAVEEITNKGVGKKTATELREFVNQKAFGNIRIELLNLLHPFSNAFFALREEGKLTQINVRELGSGIEIILTLLILKNIAGASKGSIIYLIDEPELHLHPKAQEKLLELLLEEAKTKQIVVSTHSPYLFKGAISQNATLLMFTRDNQYEVVISDARSKGWGLFPTWSPSWGEINYFAFNLPTIEFHDELYGFLHARYIGGASSQQETDVRSRQNDFETNYLQSKLKATKKWTPEIGGKVKAEESVTLATFIRNRTHHPENKTMGSTSFSDKDLSTSISELISLVKQP